jgi:predicted PurR-regulated permease PerM
MTTSVPPWLRIGSEWAVRLLLIGAGIYFLGEVLGFLRVVVLPIALALLISTLLLPPKRWLVRHGWRPAPATLVTMLAAFLLVGGILTAIAPSIGNQVSDLSGGVQDGVRKATDVLSHEPFNLSESEINQRVDDALKELRSNSGPITRGLTSGAVVVGEVLTGLIVTLLLTFFFLKDGRRMWTWLVWLVARGREEDVDALGKKVYTALSGYIRGIALVGLVDAVLIGLALLIIGVPLVVPLMILTFFGAFMPLIGAFLAGLAAVLIALVSNGLVAALFVLLAIILVQQVEGHLLYPILMSRTVHLHPAVIVLALATGGVVAGIIGVFLAVPVAAAISVTIAHVRGSAPPVDSPVVDPPADAGTEPA